MARKTNQGRFLTVSKSALAVPTAQDPLHVRAERYALRLRVPSSWRAFLYILGLSLFIVSVHASTAAGRGAADGNAARSSVQVRELKTEHLSEPLGIQTARPRFRWLLD